MADFVTQMLTQVGDALVSSVTKLVSDIVWIIPGLIGAFVLAVVGIFLGKYAKKAVSALVESTHVDHWLEEKNLKEAIGHRTLASIFGSFAKWYVIVIFLAQALDLIRMQVLRRFTEFLIGFVNSLIGALIILIGGLLVARYVRNVIDATEYRYKRTLAVVIEVMIVYVTAVISLNTVGVNTKILTDAFTIGFTVLVLAVAILAGAVLAFAFKKELVQAANDFKKEIQKP